MRLQGRGNPTPFHDLVFLATFLLLSCGSAIESAPELLPSSPTRLQSRDDNEHVVLADCKGGNGVLSSQMAYYPRAPDASPQDVAVVTTPHGQARLWAGKTTSGLFTDTGVTFTAKLGPKVDEGQFAGTGNNGYGNFSCWQKYSLNLYTYDGTTCSQVYDCDHLTAPKSTSSSAPSPTNTAKTDSGGLTQGAKVGVIVGVVCGVAAVAAIVGFIVVRRKRRTRAAGVDAETTSKGGFLSYLWKSRSEPPEGSDRPQEEWSPSGTHELEGRRNEMEGSVVGWRGELEGVPRSELDAGTR